MSSIEDLLAIIHRDGGHYQSEHGKDKAIEDAIMVVCNLRVNSDHHHSMATVFATTLKQAMLDYIASNGSLPTWWTPYISLAVKEYIKDPTKETP